VFVVEGGFVSRWFPTTFVFAVLVASLALGAGCSDRKLVPVEDEQLRNFDDRLELEVDFCTREAAETTFPVKVLLVLDGSGSLQFTDQSGLRHVAVRDLMSSLATQQDVFVATMVFGSNLYVEPQPTSGQTFIPAAEWIPPAFLNLADVQTNYQGALSGIRSHLLMDMLNSDPAELARTKYVILFFSDGTPSPVCCIAAEEDIGALNFPFGCGPEPWESAAAGVDYCEGSEEQTICDESDWLDNVRNIGDPNAASVPDYGEGTLETLSGLEVGDNYNRVYQQEDLVQEVMEMAETFGVGELRFHTALLWDSTLADAVKEIYRLNRCRAEGLLQRMAELGNGVFRDFEGGEDIDFLSFNFTSLKQGYGLVQTLAMNATAIHGAEGAMLADTDGDGLDDETEQELGTDPAVADSDKQTAPAAPGATPVLLTEDLWGDGYNDLVELERDRLGYDPLYQSLPVTACPGFDPARGVDQLDEDGDGLNGCEENLYGTDRTRPDTDGDGLSDFIEARLGTDPTVREGDLDSDFDGVKNMDEVRRGTDPVQPEVESDGENVVVRYELIEGDPTEDGRRCFAATARDIRLVTTAPRIAGGKLGFNDVHFWIAEAPLDNPTGRTELRFGCVRVQYIAPSYKDPPQGRVTLTEDDLVDLSNPEDIARLAAGEDVCVGRTIE
jgi:hypothetical protein